MAIEIERKFLVKGDGWRSLAAGRLVRQGYISAEKEAVLRVRIAGDKAWLTVKGENRGISRLEFEYEIPLEDAAVMLDKLCEKPIIEKTRYEFELAGVKWCVDEFHNENAGLIIAEVELQNENQQITLPNWIGREVSNDARYYNSNLIKNPISVQK